MNTPRVIDETAPLSDIHVEQFTKLERSCKQWL